MVGNRWNLLIVRELLLRGACRYTDLQTGLPGIATNLLADRLRQLEQANIVSRDEAPPPIATALFTLTERGRELEPVLRELGRWGTPFMAESSEQEAYRSHWLAFPVELYLTDQTPERPPISIEVRTGQTPMTIETINGALRTRSGSVESPDLVLAGAPQLVLGVLTGKLDLASARASGMRTEGDPEILHRLLPAPAAPCTGLGSKRSRA